MAGFRIFGVLRDDRVRESEGEGLGGGGRRDHLGGPSEQKPTHTHVKGEGSEAPTPSSR
jgi:hypothetical protein